MGDPTLAGTRANRRALRTGSFMPELPRRRLGEVLAMLEAGRHPGDGLVLI